MTEAGPSTSEHIVSAGSRLTGIDVARAFALFGMMATHILTGPDENRGAMGAIHTIAGGRAAALFAVLAGAGLALASGADRPTPEQVARTRRVTLVRSAALIVLGLTLGLVDTPVAIILAYYGVLFLFAVPVLAWRARPLAALAVGCAIVTPVLSYWLRGAGGLDEPPGANLAWTSLSDPAGMVRHLLLTGYYPALTWTTYVFAGLAAGRLALRKPRVALAVAATGAVLAVVGSAVSEVALRAAGGFSTLVNSGLLSRYSSDGQSPNDGFFGTSPVNDAWWLLVRVAHSGSITDLVHTVGTSMLIIGLTVAVVPALSASGQDVPPAGVPLVPVPRVRKPSAWVPPVRVSSIRARLVRAQLDRAQLDRARLVRVPLHMLAAAGSMTLTLYCLHVIAVGLNSDQIIPPWPYLALNIVGAVIIALFWGAPRRRGPVEDAIVSIAGVAVPR